MEFRKSFYVLIFMAALGSFALAEAPEAKDDAYTTDWATVLDVAAPGLLLNDFDADNDPLETHIVEWPERGHLDLFQDGSFRYTPEAGYSGPVTFIYKAWDGAEGDDATVTIQVEQGNRAPVSQNDYYTTDWYTPLTIPVPGVLGNDSDPDGDPLEAILEIQPSHGSIEFRPDGSFTFYPDAGYAGPVTFQYKAWDGTLGSAFSTVTIDVTQGNYPPNAQDDFYGTDWHTPIQISAPGLLANDNDPEGTPLETHLESGPTHGSLDLFQDGSFNYYPEVGYAGPVTFQYKAWDGLEATIATVTINVSEGNLAPKGFDDAYSTDWNTTLRIDAPGILSNDSDPDGDPLESHLVQGPSHGQLSLLPDGSFIYEPEVGYAGEVTFTYNSWDGQLADEATVTITIVQGNLEPVAQDDFYTTDWDTPLEVSAPGVLGNDSDPDGDPLEAHIQNLPSTGSLDFFQDGSFIYYPEAGFEGPVTFEYKAWDGGLTSLATVTIDVTAGNYGPIAQDDAYTAEPDTRLYVDPSGVLENDSDPEGDPLETFLVEGPAVGVLGFHEDGSFWYDPEPGFFGTVTFEYKVSDGLAVDFATVTIEIGSGPMGGAYCAYPAEPDQFGRNGGHALWLPKIARDFVWINGTGVFSEFGDGTAMLTGTVASESKPDYIFEVEVFFSGYTDEPPPGSPKRELRRNAYVNRGGPVDPATWHYYLHTQGTLTGAGVLEGAILDINRKGPAFQVGEGANGKNVNFGASGWLKYKVLFQPTNGPHLKKRHRGDFNLDLDDNC